MKLITHTGFGDHCICYGFIKEYAKNCDEIYLFAKGEDMHINNVKRLYSSINNVIISTDITDFDKIILCDDDWYNMAFKWCEKPILSADDENLIFDRHFYVIAEISFNLKWDNFYFKRNLQKEKEVYYDKLDLKDNEEFIFMQEDITRKYTINRKYINSSIKLIESSKLLDISILDMLYVVEMAKEVHVINSSFLTFIDLMNIQHFNLNYHKYIRPCIYEQVALRLNWNIIN